MLSTTDLTAVNSEAASQDSNKGIASAVSTTRTPSINTHQPPPARSTVQSLRRGLRSFGRYVTTPLGFLVTLYGLNIVAWGGMLFLLLCNAAPAMCYPSCNDINSPRRKWIEWDSQILNALFCVTGLGFAPMRFRDLYFLLQYRLLNDRRGLRRLAGIYRAWLRLPGSETISVNIGPQEVSLLEETAFVESLPLPITRVPDPPSTGVRASPTQLWKVDVIIWLFVWNTLFQICLCVFMWGMNRHNRPSWATGLFVGLGCVVAMAGGYLTYLEGSRVKATEGVPVSEEQLEHVVTDSERGLYHHPEQ